METELKFEVEPAIAEQLLEELALARDGEELILKSVYYDTKDEALRGHGLALRIRLEGERLVQTIKQATPDPTRRGEWETDIEGPAPDLKAAAKTPLAKAIGADAMAALKPAFEVTVERARRTLDVEGGRIEVALDRGAVNADGYGSPICELELELKSGEPAALFALARDIGKRAPLSLSFFSKADRGYALIEGALLSPVKAKRPALTPKDTAEQAFRVVAASNLAQITANARVLRAARRPEAVHQLRVGIRRLRTAIALFGPMLADSQCEPMKAELKWITGELSDARNLDVFIAETFRPIAHRRGDEPGMASLGASLLAAQTHAYDRTEKAVRSPRFAKLMLEIAAWIDAGAWRVNADPTLAALRARPAKALAAEVIGKHHRKVIKRGRKLDDLSPEARHHLRIQAKKLRYAADFFAGLYRGDASRRQARLTKALSAVQDGLGELNDIAVGAKLIFDLVGAGGEATTPPSRRKPDPAQAFAAGQLCADREADADKAMAASLKAYKRLADAKAWW